MRPVVALLSLVCLASTPPAQAESPPVAANDAPAGHESEPAPVQVGYDMPMDGFVAVDIHEKASGKLVRRLISETFRKQGAVSEDWNLQDNNGQPVPPGDYFWKGIARPPFKLTYELSVYNAGIPAWWAPPPAKGGGGWLADHTMASDVIAQPDMVWISAPCAESGHAMIATDLDGVKLWGTGMGHFGFDGPRKIAADDRCAYAATVNMLFRVDPKRGFAARPIFSFPNSADLPWQTPGDVSQGGGGLVARDGKLYYSVCAPSSWLRPSFIADDIDPLRCQPVVYLYRGHGHREGRDDKVYGFETYDELMCLYAAFCCDRTPAQTPTLPNFPLDSSTAAYFGDAVRAGPFKGSVVVAFRKPVPVGTILVPDGGIQVLAMKPDKQMPTASVEALSETGSGTDSPAKEEEEQDTSMEDLQEAEGSSSEWVLVKGNGPPGRPAVIPTPEGGLKATALRFKVNRLAYGLVMAHRLEDVAPKAVRLFREGRESPSGGWTVTRTNAAITEFRPAVVGLAWPEKQALRGVTLVRPPGGHVHSPCRFALDAWVGPDSPKTPEALDQDSAWRTVRHVEYAHAPMVHQIDFGGPLETAGLRVRFLSVMSQDGRFTAGFESVVVYHPIGGDPKDLPPDLSQRVSVFKLPPPDDDKQPAAVERHIPLPRAGDLAFDAAGTLHAVSGGQVVTVPLEEGQTGRVVLGRDKLGAPLDLAFAPDGLLHVADGGPKAIKVFKPDTGELVRTIGTPGGLKTGKWDPSRFNCPTGLVVDRLGRPWVADWCWSPKRVVRWTADGQPDKEFLGPTQYGGGGTMDCRDRRFIYYAGMKFVIDWDDHTWKLDSLLGHVVDRTVYWQGRRYLVGPTPGGGRLITIAEEKGDVAKLMAQAGYLNEWQALRQVPALRDRFGGLDLARQFFVWSDLNGDRQPQVEELAACEAPGGGRWTVGEDLALVSTGRRLRLSAIRPDGVPVYDLKQLEGYNASIPQSHNDNPWGDEQGRIFLTGARLVAADGKTVLWDYPNRFNHHDGFYAAGFGHSRPPGVLNQEHSPIGHIKVGNEDFFVTNSDAGDWFCYSADGMLVGCILGGPAGYGRKAWSMPEWEPGKTDLSDLRPGQEHYQGCVVSTDDGHVYAVAGHNHISVVRVDGLERLKRMGGQLTVTPEDAEKTRLWLLREATRQQTAQAPKVAKALRVTGSPEISGSHEDWPEELFVVISETINRGIRRTETIVDGLGALAFDSRNLYVAIRVRDKSPLRNNAQDPLTLFKSGDAAEVTLGLDPKADPRRTGPAAGDVRLLFAMLKGKPVAVLYKPVDPEAPAEVRREFSSPISRVRLDRVEVLTKAKVAFQTQDYKDGKYWLAEAAVPWKAIGATPPAVGTTLRGDFGYLESDENGTQTVGRKYWSGKTQTVISDLPSEARLNPSLWGQFQVVKAEGKLTLTVMGSVDPMGGADPSQETEVEDAEIESPDVK